MDSRKIVLSIAVVLAVAVLVDLSAAFPAPEFETFDRPGFAATARQGRQFYPYGGFGYPYGGYGGSSSAAQAQASASSLSGSNGFGYGK